jgi:phosphatidylglycerol:prolipoprotein diacylglycerol transferase
MAYPYLHDVLRALFGIDIFFPIPTFGLIFTTATIIGFRVIKRENRRMEDTGLAPIPEKGPRLSQQTVELAAVTMVSGVLGARVFHILEHPLEFWTDPLGMIFTRSGLSVLGGWICGSCAGAWFFRRYRFPIGRGMDALAPGIVMGYALGRWGCQIAGDGDWGIPANMALKPDWLPTWFWAQTYRGNVIGMPIDPPGVYPTPVYESAASLLIFVILWRVRKHPYGPGWLFAFFLVLTGIERFWIEKIRHNPKYPGIGLSQAELVSILFVIVGAAAMAYLMAKKRRPV